MGRKRRYHVLRLAREKQEQEALKSNEPPVKAPTTNLNTKPQIIVALSANDVEKKFLKRFQEIIVEIS